MNVKNCKSCRRIFNYVTGPQICPACRTRLEDEFKIVKEYIESNPGAHVSEVARECHISEKQIREWLREERLILTEPSLSGITCEVCGLPITAGRYCDTCKASTINMLNGVIPKKVSGSIAPKKNDDHKAQMRFLNR